MVLMLWLAARQIYINKTKKFPDFQDVMFLVKAANRKKKLGLTNGQLKAEAEQIFLSVGKSLKERRVRDFAYDLGHKTIDEAKEEGTLKDPADSDPTLKKALEENQNECLNQKLPCTLGSASPNRPVDNTRRFFMGDVLYVSLL